MVNVTVNFSETVLLTGGNLTMTLDSGGAVTIPPFTGTAASGTYTILAGQTSADLNVTNLSLAGGATLNDIAGNAANLTLPASNLAVNANIIVNPAPPTTVSFIAINLGAVQRSRVTQIDVTFNNPVNVANYAPVGAITLTRTSGGSPVVLDSSNGLSIAPLTGMVSTLTLTFTGNNGVESSSLADGRWQLAIPYLSYTSPLNDPNLRRLFGDSNNDGTVDGTDFGDFGSVFGQTVANSPFDSNGDGTVDGTDFAQFGTRFGITL
jgi:hypothetical protein